MCEQPHASGLGTVPYPGLHNDLAMGGGHAQELGLCAPAKERYSPLKLPSGLGDLAVGAS